MRYAWFEEAERVDTTIDLGDGQKQVVASVMPLVRGDGSEIDPAWVESPTAADLELEGESLKAYAMRSYGAARVMRVVNQDGWLEYRPLPLLYAHSLTDLVELAVRPGRRPARHGAGCCGRRDAALG